LETGRYLLRATNTGVSGIVDPQGKLVETVAPYTQGVVTGEIVAYAGSTPYVRFGNYPVVVGMSGILLLMFLLVRFNRRIG
jgi:apolipoprotein N-acyltransferase